MDILYIVGKGCSKCDDFELKCSLRSIAEFGKNIDNVYIVGWCPDWLSDEIHKIPFEQQKAKNMEEKCDIVRRAIEYAIDNSDISEDFLVSMDDHFYVRSVDFDNYPYYNKDYKKRECREILPNQEMDINKQDSYTNVLRKTRAFLEENNLPYYNLSPHRNMHCTKTVINECRNLRLSGIEPLLLWLNYQYNKEHFDKVIIEDVKIKNGGEWWKTDPALTEVFSTADFKKKGGLYVLLSGLYPNKCKYEK